MSAKKFVVVGGSGFLGSYIVEHLVNRGETNVTVFDIKKGSDMKNVKYIIGDITNLSDLENAFKGVDTVIHTASPLATSGHEGVLLSDSQNSIFHKVNVIGTKNVVEACVSQKVKQLIYTSTSSVVWYGQNIRNGDESLPYCKTHLDTYSQTKELAERSIIEANGRGGLMTCVIRPVGIFGPRDQQSLVGFYGVARTGNSKWVYIGNRRNKFDWTYVENIAYAHALAADKMTEGSNIAGQVFFITNDEPIQFWDFADYLWKGLGYPTPKIGIPFLLMYWIAVLVAFIVKILAPIIEIRPAFTPLRVCAAGTERTFNIDKAKKMLGYKPIVSLEEGMKRSLEWLKEEVKSGRLENVY